MDTTISIDLGQIARELNLPPTNVQRTLELLEEGNTIPFITRFRKDQTGALDEQQIREIVERAAKLKALADRKQTIVKSIEAQGRLTPELVEEIRGATSAKRLEDLYLPFKPKKQTLATVARQRGLEPLAQAILDSTSVTGTIEERAASFVAEEKSLPTAADVVQGVRHLLAEHFSELPNLRDRLRKQIRQSGRLIASRMEPPERTDPAKSEAAAAEPVTEAPVLEAPADAPEEATTVSEDTSVLQAAQAPTEIASDLIDSQLAESPQETAVATAECAPADEVPEPEAEATTAPGQVAVTAPETPPEKLSSRALNRAAARTARANKKEKKRQKLEAAFKDYFQFSEPLTRIPPHRVLAINRGERARILRVRLEVDAESLYAAAEKCVLTGMHPYHEFLATCLRDALQRLILPSLEREVRRELTEASEEHAVEVFIRNLRKLLLQPPVRGRKVLAVDPGFRNGCKLIAIDEFGYVLGHEIMHVVGRDERKKSSRTKIGQMIRQYGLNVVAIGNGTGCRETEQIVAEAISEDLPDIDIAYVVVNEAGASVYSTSPIGREELPDYDPVLRSAISIGRRLLDPLSELVKINPANIGVGLYQHDVKAKHLRESLDSVVESCVNYVGVDVNTASPALLRYVSGLNQLTARRLYEHRRTNGPFRTRDDLKQVTGVGDATFVQAAGFLKINDGDNPLDATWIHPESYEVALRVLQCLGADVDVLRPLPPRPQQTVATSSLGEEKTVGPISPTEPTGPTEESPAVEASEPVITEAVTTEAVPTEAVPTEAVPAEAVPAEAVTTEAVTTEAPSPADPTQEMVAWEAAQEARQAARTQLSEKANAVSVTQLAQELGISELLLKDLLAALVRPGRDPREDLPPPVFRRGIMKLEDLKPGMEMSGTVLNVVDFGAFVDIGLTESGLVHISRLADRYIRDPHEVVGVGDTLHVWVLEVDKERRRVSLTAVPPGTERRKPEPRQKPAARSPARPPAPPKPQTAAKTPAARPSVAAPAGRAPPPRQPRRDRGGKRPPRGAKPRTWTATSSLPAKPLTKDMEEGKEPLRSFADLLQFYEKKKGDDSEPSEGQ